VLIFFIAVSKKISLWAGLPKYMERCLYAMLWNHYTQKWRSIPVREGVAPRLARNTVLSLLRYAGLKQIDVAAHKSIRKC